MRLKTNCSAEGESELVFFGGLLHYSTINEGKPTFLIISYKFALLSKVVQYIFGLDN